MPDRNTIAMELSAEDLMDFSEECTKTPKLTLAKIQELAAKRGIRISLMSATSFRDTTFKRHIESIKQARELAEQVGELERRAPGHTLADAASDVLSKKVLDALTNPERVEDTDLSEMSLIVKRLRDGDSKAKALHLKQLDAAKVAIAKSAEIKNITSDTSLDSGQKLERVRQLLFGIADEE